VTDYTAQLRMLGQGDADQWIDLLIIVVLGVFYAVASLIKTARRKSQQAERAGPAPGRSKPAESWQQRLARKAEEIQRAVEAKNEQAAERIRRLEQQARVREPMADSRSAPGPVPPAPRPHMANVLADAGRGGESGGDAGRRRHAAREQRVKEAVSAAGREAAKQPTDVVLEAVAPDAPDKEMMPMAPDLASYDPASIIDSSDPGALQKAVLHYEILGKPVGLRDPFEQGLAP
jgi:hypothetical protein